MQTFDRVIWLIHIPNTSPHPSSLDDNVDMGSFNDKTFTVDTATLYAIIIKLCDVNKTLNVNVQSLMRFQDGRTGYKVL